MAKIKGKWEWYNTITDEPCSLTGRGFSFESNNEPFIGLRIFVGANGGVDIAYLYDEDDQGIYYMGNSDIVNSNYRAMDFGSIGQEIDDELYDFIVKHAISKDPRTVKGKWRWNEIIHSTDSADLMSGCRVSFTSNNKSYDRLSVNTSFILDNGEHIGTVWALFYGHDEVCTGEIGSTSIPISPEYREMDFGSSEQEISYELYLYLIENAIYQLPAISDKLREIAENEQKVYDAGRAAGYHTGYNTGYEHGEAAGVEYGRQAEHSDFWDIYQNYGNRKYYDSAFCESGNYAQWRYGTTYRPKYPIKPGTASSMFSITRLPYEAIHAVDFSRCTEFRLCFTYYSGGKKIPPIDLRVATVTQNMFAWSSNLEEIEELLVTESTPYSACFTGCSNLKEVRFNGTIGQNGLDFRGSPLLSKESIKNVVEHLSDSTAGLTLTFSLAAVNKAFETSEGENDGEWSGEWTAVVATKQNWTISLL